MNYYEHHIGDYDSATAHLSALEDGIYGRLLRLYYRTEVPLPGDLKQLCRLVRALSKQEREAVESVLNEFFELHADGWRQHRADVEIARFQDKQRKARASAEARWSQSDRNANASDKSMRTHMRTQSSGNADGMHRAPVPRHQTPDTNTSDATHPQLIPPRDARSVAVVKADDLVAEGVDASVAKDWLAVRKVKKAPLTLTAWEGVKREAAAAGLTPAEAVRLAAESGWQGFKAAWLKSPFAQGNGSHHSAFEGAE